jgi:hypothetical protein
MANSKASLRFSGAFSTADRVGVVQIFIDEQIDAAEEGDIAYRGTGVSPEHLVVDFIIGYGILQFLQGYVSAASADAWGATKRAFKHLRARHRGGQEINIFADEGTFLARYLLPSDPLQWDAAIDAIAQDLVALQRPDERWWLYPPVSRWGTALEAANQQNSNH